MHRSAYDHMGLCVQQYMPAGRHYRVLDLGARVSAGQTLTHRQLLAGHSVSYVGIDPVADANVDIVMTKPYSFPIPSGSVDVLMSGQVFEHIPFFWATMLEIGRVLRPGGHAFITAPSRGHTHSFYDCWRYYPDGYRAMAAWSGLELREAFTDFPPATDRRRHDYRRIDVQRSYWGDSIGVFRKPAGYPRLQLAVVRAVNRWWANRVGGLDGVPVPPPLPERDRLRH